MTLSVGQGARPYKPLFPGGRSHRASSFSLIFNNSPDQCFYEKTKGHTLLVCFLSLSLVLTSSKMPVFLSWIKSECLNMVVKVFHELVCLHPASLVSRPAHSRCSRNKTACFLRTLDAASHVYDLMLILPLRCRPTFLLTSTLFSSYVFFCTPMILCT